MDKYSIHGVNHLKGQVEISGSKNAALPILAASLLTKETLTLTNVPDLMDIRMMIALLETLGKEITFEGNIVVIRETDSECYEAPYEIVRKMRASIAVMGPLLGRKNKAKVSFPGGCAIGPRPIDLHLKGFKALGAEMVTEHGYIWAKAEHLKGVRINLMGLNGPSVLATENVMMAAVLAEGVTVIEGTAEEPEVSDLAGLLNKMGAKISGFGTPIITIEGVNSLKGGTYQVIPDRIEAGTFIALAGLCKGPIRLKNINVSHLGMAIETFSEAGVEFEILSDTELIAAGQTIRPLQIETQPYPYFPTDLQAQMMAMVAMSDGISVIKERIFPDRFMHAAELNRMGADIKVDGDTAVIKGVKDLSGASVMASDLRAGAGLVIAALGAHGHSEILRIYHIDRGYERFEQKLQTLGADIKRLKQS